jgi:hypothetical protein
MQFNHKQRQDKIQSYSTKEIRLVWYHRKEFEQHENFERSFLGDLVGMCEEHCQKTNSQTLLKCPV